MAKLQSAIEYLMTYGWAILIIVIVLSILFYLNVFNPNFWASKASPGSCRVSRPYGPKTTSLIAFEGECLDELPKSVMHTTGLGQSFATVAQPDLFGTYNSFTVSFWVEPTGTMVSNWAIPLSSFSIFRFQSTYGSEYSGMQLTYQIGSSNTGPGNLPSSFKLLFNNWYFVALTYDGQNAYYYVNGQLINEMPFSSSGFGTPSSLQIGTLYGSVSEWNGSLSNIQMYNTSLSGNEIAILYGEGIGGRPTNLQALSGWWPLNGNVTDYSGNNNGGVAKDVIFENNWWYSYSAP
ncbi:LamG domain-containing protein [Candidatus Marsarchaeota archaeon]|nr:LamG domain-containing protein [Candidatus Marsarchaeota archaeon]